MIYLAEKKLNKADNYPIPTKTAILKKYYKEFNEKYFNNKLPDIPLKWKNFKTFNGYFKFTYNWADMKLNPIEISINRAVASSFIAFRNTLVHEMLHFYVDCIDSRITKEMWGQALKYRVFGGRYGKQAIANALGTSDEKAHTGRWLELAEQFNEQYEELYITRKSLNVDALIEDDDDLKAKYKDIHIVIGYCPNCSRKAVQQCLILNDDAYRQLLDKIENGLSNIQEIYKWDSSQWYEYDILDFEKLSTKVAPIIWTELDTRYYGKKMIDVLKSQEIISGSRENHKFLGRMERKMNTNENKIKLEKSIELLKENGYILEKKSKWSKSVLDKLGLSEEDLEDLDDEDEENNEGIIF